LKPHNPVVTKETPREEGFMNLQPVAISPVHDQRADFLNNYTKKYGLYANDFIA
jgi:hypothetical protein